MGTNTSIMSANLSMMIKDAMILSEDPRKEIVILVSYRSMIDNFITKKIQNRKSNNITIIGTCDDDCRDRCYRLAGAELTDLFLYDIPIESHSFAVTYTRHRLRGNTALHYYGRTKSSVQSVTSTL